MPTSIADEEFITLKEACKRVPGRVHVNTIRRWMDRGFNGVILKSWRCGNRRLTSVAAIDAFMAATTGIRNANPHSTSSAHQRAESTLDAMGVV